MIFYLGTHRTKLAQQFNYTFISVNILRKRKSDFEVNNWIMDSGAFTEITTYGKYRYEVSEYANLINRWSICGNLEAAISQDYMCEPFALSKTGLTIQDHQRLTIERYDSLLKLTNVTIIPVLQGYALDDYCKHLYMYGDRLKLGQRVGVGSICKRNSKPSEISAILQAIKNLRPDLKLHGFGLKTTSLLDNYITSLIYSADSMAWSYAARREHRNPNSFIEALSFYNKVINSKGKRIHQFSLTGG